MNGGQRVAEVLRRHGIESIFTLIGGHISPILVASKAAGLKVVDVRHEVSAVFAADAAARLTGKPGVAAVTAGPGVTNTVTALQNARMAQSPILLIGGATATALRGRGSLQDIDQLSPLRPICKWATRVSRLRDLIPTIEKALDVAVSDVPGPVFVELPVDLLYDEEVVRSWYAKELEGGGKSIGGRVISTYMSWHLDRLFGDSEPVFEEPQRPEPMTAPSRCIEQAAAMIRAAERPVVVVGSQVVVDASQTQRAIDALESLGAPVFLAGASRGLLGHTHRLQFRHRRGKALRKADCVILLGFPMDFRLGYGKSINRKAKLITVNRERSATRKNRRPTLPVWADPTEFLAALPSGLERAEAWKPWFATLATNEAEREVEIDELAAKPGERINPVQLCRAIEEQLPEDSVLVVDGGDFVATGAYTIRPRGPLRWLDPGVFGTLGVGGGFATGAAVSRPGAQIWMLYGDGAAGFSFAEFDTFARFGLPVVAVVGNDAAWGQILRDQATILGDDVGCILERSDYQKVAEAFGGLGIKIERPDQIEGALRQAREAAAKGQPVLINALLDRSDFRAGSLSM